MRPMVTRTAVVALLLAAPRVEAQDVTATPTRAARNAITVDLLGLSRGIYTGEYSRTVGGPLALGLGIAYFGERWNEAQLGMNGRDRQLMTEVRLRGYSERTPFRGAALVVHAGAFGERDARYDTTPERTTVDFAWRYYPTFALSAEQAWSSGRRGEPVLIVGAGYRATMGRPGFPVRRFVLDVSLGGLF
jgi:hypothetical protein